MGGRRALVLSTPGQRGSRDAGGRRAGRRHRGDLRRRHRAHPGGGDRRRPRPGRGRSGADSVVSIGGGSTTGLGKALAARTGLPHLVVPTTYAGSEVTSLLGETADGEKVTRTGPEILPQVVVYDVALTTTLPWAVTVTSAVNAMAHTVEALYAADRTAETDAMAVDGLGALARGLSVAPPRPRRPRRARRPALRRVAGGSVPRGGDHGPAPQALPHPRRQLRPPARGHPHRGASARDGLQRPGSGRRHERRQPLRSVSTTHPPGCRPWSPDSAGPTDLRHLGFTLDDVPRAADLATARPYPNPRPVQHDGIVELLTPGDRRHPPSARRQGEPMTTPDPSTPSPAELEARRQEIRAGPPAPHRVTTRLHRPRSAPHGPDQR